MLKIFKTLTFKSLFTLLLVLGIQAITTSEALAQQMGGGICQVRLKMPMVP